MGDLKLFRVDVMAAQELKGTTAPIEKELQILMEKNLTTLLGVRFLASEYSTGKKHGGRIDTLGLDESNSPVIIEYKRRSDENVINQGLFYLNWLLDHRAEFQLLVAKMLGMETAEVIDWANPRLVCVAGTFTKYDEHAVLEINRSIDLIRYRQFPGDFMALELISTTAVSLAAEPKRDTGVKGKPGKFTYKTVSEFLEDASVELKSLYQSLEDLLLSTGDDVTKKVTQQYFAFRRIKNFACVEVHAQTQTLVMHLKIDPSTLDPMPPFARDVSKIGHYGTGDLEVRMKTTDDLALAENLIRASYEAS